MVQKERRPSQVVIFASGPQNHGQKKSVVYQIPIQLEWKKVRLLWCANF